MKKIINFVLVLLVLVSSMAMFTGCNSIPEGEKEVVDIKEI